MSRSHRPLPAAAARRGGRAATAQALVESPRLALAPGPSRATPLWQVSRERARTAVQEGQHQAAGSWYRRAISLVTAENGGQHPALSELFGELAHMLWHCAGERQQALEALRLLLHVSEAVQAKKNGRARDQIRLLVTQVANGQAHDADLDGVLASLCRAEASPLGHQRLVAA